MAKSKYVIKKSNQGALYRECKGQEIEFLYKVCKCKGNGDCKKCVKSDSQNWISVDKVKVTLGNGQLHEYIEKVLLGEEKSVKKEDLPKMRRGSAIFFFLAAEDAFGEVGVKDTKSDNYVIGPGESVCCYLEDTTY